MAVFVASYSVAPSFVFEELMNALLTVSSVMPCVQETTCHPIRMLKNITLLFCIMTPRRCIIGGTALQAGRSRVRFQTMSLEF